MGKYDFEEELSDSDNDDFLKDEIAALSAACLPSTSAGAGAGAVDFSDEDDGDDDLELVRSLKEQYGLGDADVSQPLSLKPLTTLPPVDSDDEEDDFETLRAIQRRFSQYGDGSAAGVGGGGGEPDATESQSENFTNKLLPDDATCMNLGNESFDACRNDRDQGPCSTSESRDTSNHSSSFPKAAQTFIEAIKKNRSCQKFLRSKLLHIETRMEEIKALLKKINTLKAYQVACKKKIGRALSQKQDARLQLISIPKQRSNVKGAEKNISPMCNGPVENSHVASYRAALANFPLSFQRESWEKDSEKLEKGIRQQLQKLLIEKSADVLSDLGEPGFAHGWDDIISSVRNFEITSEIMQDFVGKVNWEEVASMYLPHRSGAECEAGWLNNGNPLINRDNWTPAEDKQLLLLIQHYGINNWSLIAEKLKTNRTPFQCLARYQRSLNASILKREWTEDEDAQLRSAVESFGESNWQVVASTLEGRTGTQCSNRWNKTLHPTRQRVGKWSADEDKRLKVAVTLFGRKNWHRLAQFVPGRTQAQCRERWVNILDPSLNRGAWTQEEDLKLKAAIREHGYCWSRIAACLNSRTDNQCRRRWKRLFPHEVPLLQAAKRIQKVALISNFVDRESERPALGPNDFAPLQIEDSINEAAKVNRPKRRQARKSGKSGLCREVTPCRTSKKAQSRKNRKRAKSPENEMMGDHCDAQSNNGGRILLTYKRRKSRKSGSKEMIPSGSTNVAVESREKPTNTLKEAQSTECRTRAISPETDMISDMTNAGQSDVDNIMKNKKMMTHKSGSKKRKRGGRIDIGREYKMKSSESKNSDDAGDMTWDVPIRIWSRRARGVCSKKIAPASTCRALQTTGTHGTNESTTASEYSSEESYDPKMQHDKSTCSNSESGTCDDLEAQIPCTDDFTGKQSRCKQKLETKTLNERALEDGSSAGNSVTSACNDAESQSDDASESRKRKCAKTTRKQSKSQSDRSEKWEELPLAALFKKGASCRGR